MWGVFKYLTPCETSVTLALFTRSQGNKSQQSTMARTGLFVQALYLLSVCELCVSSGSGNYRWPRRPHSQVGHRSVAAVWSCRCSLPPYTVAQQQPVGEWSIDTLPLVKYMCKMATTFLLLLISWFCFTFNLLVKGMLWVQLRGNTLLFLDYKLVCFSPKTKLTRLLVFWNGTSILPSDYYILLPKLGLNKKGLD